jgi:UDP-N-acetylglucosamine 2-epimerase (non-hydrolysing)
MTTVYLVAAARPNFMKVAPLWHALKREPWCETRLVHTGQHYDAEMSEFFFRDLGLPDADFHLGAGSGSHARQTAAVMVAYEELCQSKPPDWTVVVGDVNSTMACTLAAKKLNLKVAHLEAGLRSGDRTMPEEINRVVTDALADLLWTPSPDGDENLRREGVIGKVERVGNIMIDCLVMLRSKIDQAATAHRLGLEPRCYGVVTFHRPSNVDTRAAIEEMLAALTAAADRLPLIFPLHPRTRERLTQFGVLPKLEAVRGLRLLPALGYIEFMSLLTEAAVAITDSGGIQEETTYLGVPCLTVRENTERPVTVSIGTNRLIRMAEVGPAVVEVLSAPRRTPQLPELWDGRTAGHVVASLRCASGIAP